MAKKKARKSMGRCAGCGTGIAKKRQLCHSCVSALQAMGHQPAAAKSAAPAFLAKSAGGSVVPSWQPAVIKMAGAKPRPRCRRGCGKSRAGADCCTSCGSLLPGRVVAPPVIKSYADSGDYWTRRMMQSADPAERELIRDTFVRPAEMLTKSAGNVSYLHPAAERDLLARLYAEPDPGRRQDIWQELHPESRGGGAA